MDYYIFIVSIVKFAFNYVYQNNFFSLSYSHIAFSFILHDKAFATKNAKITSNNCVAKYSSEYGILAVFRLVLLPS